MELPARSQCKTYPFMSCSEHLGQSSRTERSVLNILVDQAAKDDDRKNPEKE